MSYRYSGFCSVLCLLLLTAHPAVFAQNNNGIGERPINDKLRIRHLPTEAGEFDLALVDIYPDLRFTFPVGLLDPNDGTDRLFVYELGGAGYPINDTNALAQIKWFPRTGNPTNNDVVVFMELLVNRQLDSGLLGMCFDPDFQTNGYFYLHFQRGVHGDQLNPLRSVIARYQATLPDLEVADPATEHILMEILQPATNHNGGNLVFDPLDDRMLLIALGDGGDQGDPRGHGQNTETLLGSLLRIDVKSEPDPGLNYKIPDDNPFVGDPGGRDEIYAWGLRSLWRMHYDMMRPEILFGGDVGQFEWEEINIIEKGKNYGWNTMEATHCFNPPSGCDQTGLTLPIAEHNRAEAESMTGGFVYHGTEVPELVGRYVYGDFDTGRIWSLEYDEKTRTATTPVEHLNHTNFELASFGQDRFGEVYALELGGGRILGLRKADINTQPGDLPNKLSDIPLLLDAAKGLNRMSDGVIPYEPSAKLWSDYAAKTRYFVLPDFNGHGALLHRWSFNQGSLADSVMGADATVVEKGGNNVTFSGDQVIMAGGPPTESDYILLGSNLLPDVEQAFTIELWATPLSVQNWSRIFDFGSNDQEFIMMSWVQGIDMNNDRVEWSDDGIVSTADTSNAPYQLNQEYHIVMALNPVSGGTDVTWWTAPSNSTDLGNPKGSFLTTNRIAALDDEFNYLGNSQFAPDNVANAGYNEVRIWSGALTQPEVESLHDNGPEDPTIDAEPDFGSTAGGKSLRNRWNFNGDLMDAAGDSDATIIDAGDSGVIIRSNEITLSGGPSGAADYVQLGSDLIPNQNVDLTIELWATQHSFQSFSRIFDFGNSTSEYMDMTWSTDILENDFVEYVDTEIAENDLVAGTNAPYNLGIEYHIVFRIQQGAGFGNEARMTWWSAPSNAEDMGLPKGTYSSANFIATLNNSQCNIGRSHFPADGVANASYNEFRIWNGALAQEDIEQLHDQGPDNPALGTGPEQDSPELRPHIGFTESQGWNFPDDSVLIKNFSLPLDRTDPEVSLKRIETRLLIKNQGQWAGFTYRWNEEETDADLVGEGAETRVFEVTDVNGSTVEQIWLYPSRESCFACHTNSANFTLGVTTEALNSSFDYPETGMANQLASLDASDFFSEPLPVPVEELPSMPDYTHEFESLQDRARAYLDSNCSMCHQPGGPAQAGMDFLWATNNEDMNALDVDPNAGDLGITGAKIITPGSPSRSLVYQRMISLNEAHRMPPLATSVVDPDGTELIRQWIGSMVEIHGDVWSVH